MYRDDIKTKLERAEKLFSVSCDLVLTTEACLAQARQNLVLHEEILEGVQYVDGVDAPEIGTVVKQARVGVRHYSRQVETLERELEIYRGSKNKAEDEWKALNRELRTPIFDFGPPVLLQTTETRMQTPHTYNIVVGKKITD